MSATATLTAPMAAKSPNAGSSIAWPTATQAVTAAAARAAVPSAPGSTVAARTSRPARDTVSGFPVGRSGNGDGAEDTGQRIPSGKVRGVTLAGEPVGEDP